MNEYIKVLTEKIELDKNDLAINLKESSFEEDVEESSSESDEYSTSEEESCEEQ